MTNLIVKDNALVEASHRLGEVEQRLILLAILKARNECTTIEELKGKELMIHADDYVQKFGINRQMSYKALKKAVLGLFEAKWGYKYVNEKGNKVVRYERFTQSAQYIEGEGVVSFKFADAIIPMLIELGRRFTSYEVEQVAQLSSQYSMRLYEFFVRHLDNKKTGKGWLDISLEELRFRLGLLPTEYDRMDNFKRKILDYSVNEINKNTNLSVSYEQKKQGRVITGFVFTYKDRTFKKSDVKKTDDKKTNDKKEKLDDIFAGLTNEQANIIKEKVRLYAEKQNITSRFHLENLHKKAVKYRWDLEDEQEQSEQPEVDNSPTAYDIFLENFDAFFEKVQQNSERFVLQNKHKTNQGLVEMLFKQKNYDRIVDNWRFLIKSYPKSFNLKGFYDEKI